MEKDHYTNRELDAKFSEVREVVTSSKNTLLEKLLEIEKQTIYTNGKVKKIIMAILLLSGLSIGLGIQRVMPIVGLFI